MWFTSRVVVLCILNFFWRSRWMPSLLRWLYLPTTLIKPFLFIWWSTYLADMLCNAYILYLVVFLMKQTLLLDIFRTVALHSWHCQTKSPLQENITDHCRLQYFTNAFNFKSNRKSQIYALILQSNQVKRTPQESINEFNIQKLNPLLQ